jgi:hypothetical protein
MGRQHALLPDLNNSLPGVINCVTAAMHRRNRWTERADGVSSGTRAWRDGATRCPARTLPVQLLTMTCGAFDGSNLGAGGLMLHRAGTLRLVTALGRANRCAFAWCSCIGWPMPPE